MQSNGLPEIVRKSETGRYIKEADYDRALSKKAHELVREYQLKFDPKVLVPDDDEMTNRLFQAGVDLIVQVGCITRQQRE